MAKRLLEAFIAVVLEESVRNFIPPLLPYAWLAILWWLTWEFLQSKKAKRLATTFYKRLGSGGRVVSYVLVAAVGAGMSLFYWMVITRAISVAEHFSKSPENSSSSVKPDEEKETKSSGAVFRDSPDSPYTVRFANNAYGIEKVNRWNPGGTTGIWSFDKGDEPSLEAYVSEDKLFFNAKLFGGSGRQVSIVKNELVNEELQWDRNFNDSALEVINQNKIPMLQIIYETPHVVQVYGVFQSAGGSFFVATPEGFTMNPGEITKVKGYPLKKLFRYPSRKYPGVEVKNRSGAQ